MSSAVWSGCADVTDADLPSTEDQKSPLRGADEKRLEGRVIVGFRDDGLRRRPSEVELAQRLLRNQTRIEQLGGRLVRQLGRINAVAAELSAEQVESLKSDPRVAFVERDPVRQPFLPVAERGVSPLAESAPYGIAMVQADQVSDAPIGNRKVCIMDTGYDGAHEDLRPATGENITGDDNNGLGNDTGDWFVDGYGHGTHVAGTIAAIGGNDLGVVGVSGSDAVGLHIVKVFNDGGSWAYGSDLVAALDQCIAAGAQVVSMSLGGSMSSMAEQNAFQAAYANGVLSIAAAGNGGNTSLSYPASYDSVVSVAALDSNKALAYFSQRNAQVELAAPGVAVLSTLPGNSYAAWDGTSMATPHVSGVAALVWSHFPDCGPNAIRSALIAGAEDLGAAGRDNSFGHGLVRAKAALDALSEHGCDVPPPPPPPPPPPREELLNGVPKTGLSGSSGTEFAYMVNIPANAANLTIIQSGGSGDADLYVRFGNEPTLSEYDCRPYTSGNYEVCTFPVPRAGRYYVKVVGYSTFTGAQVVATWDGACPSTVLTASNLPIAIPDNSAAGVRVAIPSDLEGDLLSLRLAADIKHTYRGDLVVTLIGPSGITEVLHNRTGGPADDLSFDLELPAFVGTPAGGTYELFIQDRALRDVGRLNSFQLTLTPDCQ